MGRRTFTFSLQPALDVASGAREAAERELRAAREQLAAERATYGAIDAELAACHARLAAARDALTQLSGPTLRGDDIQRRVAVVDASGRAHDGQRVRLAAQLARCAQQEAVVSSAEQAVQLAIAQVQAFERLRDRQREAFEHELARIEQNEIDEAATIRFSKR